MTEMEPRPAESGGGRRVRRWPAAVALLAIGGLYLLLSDQLTLGPPWLLLVAIVVLLVPLAIAHFRDLHDLTRAVGRATIVVVTAAVVASTSYLLGEALSGGLPGTALLQGAALIWVVNWLTFALWYWDIDGGGPAGRHAGAYASTDFLFPQVAAVGGPPKGWAPSFLDYVFLSFTTSTAFSPTDTLVLSHREKVLMMIESVTSLTAIVVLAARAVNTFR